jgi:hypothetical protein
MSRRSKICCCPWREILYHPLVGNKHRRRLMGLSLKLDVIVSAVAFLFLTAIIIGMV